MSYDIYLEADLGGPEKVGVGGIWWNYTANCAPMWREAGADLALFDQRPAWECIPLLRMGIGALEADPEKYIAMNPENGWGSYETLLPKLRELLEFFESAPKATVRVDR